jgi:hypothetical protein
MTMLIDDNGIWLFVDDNSLSQFVDDNGMILGGRIFAIHFV